VRLGWKDKGLRGTAQSRVYEWGKMGWDGGGKRCYNEVLVKCCFWGWGKNK